MKLKNQIPVLIFILSLIPFLRITSQDVGIGTTTPEFKLDIAGRARLRHEGGAFTAGLWFNNSANIAYTFSGMRSDSIWGLYGNGYKFNFDMDNTRLSIGSVIPQYPLVFEHTLGDKISLYGGGGAPNADHYGFGIQSSLMQLYTPASNTDMAFGYGRSAAFTERMRIKGNGNVGIGNTNPLDAGLIVDKKVGAVNAMFGRNTTGVAIESNFPGIGFNCYYNAGRKTIATGYTGLMNFDPVSGKLALYNSDLSTSTDAPATLNPRLTIDKDGNMGVEGNTIPHAPLTFANTFGSKISLYGNSEEFHLGFGIQGGVMQMYSGSSSSDLVFGYGGSAAFTENMRIKGTGNVGIGTNNPTRPLSFPAILGKKISLYPGATGDAGFGVFGNELRIHSDNSSADITFGYDTYPSTFTERMRIKGNGNVGIGTISPGYTLDVNGRIRLRHNGITSGLWLANSTNTNDVGFVGLMNDTHIGLYGDDGAGWNLIMNTANGRVGIGTASGPSYPFHVVNSSVAITARFVNSYTSAPIGIYADAVGGPNGTGVWGKGSLYGVFGEATAPGSGDRIGLSGIGKNGTGNNYGVYGEAGATGVSNWGGYFVGDVYSSGTYQGSDRKLKNEILPLNHALTIINQLKPSEYTYKTNEYKQMHLPEGIQYGLIADEVMQVLPGAVKRTIQPALYENNNEQNGRKLSEEVEFNSVNYTGMIPILIGAIQEQQKQIDELQKLVNELIVNREP